MGRLGCLEERCVCRMLAGRAKAGCPSAAGRRVASRLCTCVCKASQAPQHRVYCDVCIWVLHLFILFYPKRRNVFEKGLIRQSLEHFLVGSKRDTILPTLGLELVTFRSQARYANPLSHTSYTDQPQQTERRYNARRFC